LTVGRASSFDRPKLSSFDRSKIPVLNFGQQGLASSRQKAVKFDIIVPFMREKSAWMDYGIF
jgi:hypothetical protein